MSPFQSAYRRFHSTETALTKIHNDLTLAINRRQVSALILLDLSAAFDTINHSILIQRLRSVFGISGSALSILSSYLTDRSQSVLIGKSLSSEIPLARGVPQGSVLGPLLFSLYTTPLSHILNESQVQFHMYADDTQLYVSFSGSDSNQALSSLSSVLDRLYYWFCDNKLSINPSKTEFLLVGTPQQRSKVADASVSFRNLKLSHTESARNLGVMFDSELSFNSHISNVCRSSFFFIRQLRQLRSTLDYDSAVILANSIIHSKLDYCNSLFSGLPIFSIARLQRVQNSLARVVCKSKKFSTPASTLLNRLHWLNIAQRIKYKIASLTFKALYYHKPSYLSDLLVNYQPTRSLRSSSSGLLKIPDVRSEFGRRSFAYTAPTLWNSLPSHLRFSPSISTFCRQLKTYLYPP